MQRMAQSNATTETKHPGSTTVETTTLGELIQAISEEVRPKDDGLVAEIVLHLLDTGQISPIGSIGESAASFVFTLCDDPL